jgi:hypothetical protein
MNPVAGSGSIPAPARAQFSNEVRGHGHRSVTTAPPQHTHATCSQTVRGRRSARNPPLGT